MPLPNLSKGRSYGDSEQKKGIFLLMILARAIKKDVELEVDLAESVIYEAAFVQPKNFPTDLVAAAREFVDKYHRAETPAWAK